MFRGKVRRWFSSQARTYFFCVFVRESSLSLSSLSLSSSLSFSLSFSSSLSFSFLSFSFSGSFSDSFCFSEAVFSEASFSSLDLAVSPPSFSAVLFLSAFAASWSLPAFAAFSAVLSLEDSADLSLERALAISAPDRHVDGYRRQRKKREVSEHFRSETSLLYLIL